MLYHLIRLWFKRQLMWLYYKDTSIDKTDLAEALKYAKSLQILEGYWTPKTNPMELTVEYAKYMLGYYVLSAAAQNSRLAFKRVVSSAPLLYQRDESKLLTWIGGKAWSNSHNVLRADYTDGIVYTVFDISGLPIVKLKSNARNHLKLLDNKEGSVKLLETVMMSLLNDTQSDLRENVKTGEVYDSRGDMKKLKAVSYVAADYGLTNVLERANKLTEVLNMLNDKD